MRDAYLGLGSNLGDRTAHLLAAVEHFRRLDPRLEVSGAYETAPVGGPPGQGPYLNAVLRVRTALPARRLLEEANRVEALAGRVRAEKDGPRTLDVDVLVVGDERIDEEDLVVPHPRLAERAFVLFPLEELAPGLVPPDWRERLGGDGYVHTLARRVGTLRRSTARVAPSGTQTIEQSDTQSTNPS